MVDEGEVLGEAALAEERDGPLGAPLFIAVGRVNEDRELRLPREIELLGEELVFLGRLIVVADLPDRDDPVLFEVARQKIQDAPRDGGVIGLLRVQREGTKMADPELARPEPLPAEER